METYCGVARPEGDVVVVVLEEERCFRARERRMLSTSGMSSGGNDSDSRREVDCVLSRDWMRDCREALRLLHCQLLSLTR